MRFYLFGPRFFGIRPGISFQPSDLKSHKPPKSAPYIYVIKGDENNVKIGVTKNPDVRLAQLRTGNHATIDFAFIAPTSGDSYAIERMAHSMLDRYRLNGEWFDVPPELAIAAVTGAAAKLGQSLAAKPVKNSGGAFGLGSFIIWLCLTAMWIYFIISWVNSPPP